MDINVKRGIAFRNESVNGRFFAAMTMLSVDSPCDYSLSAAMSSDNDFRLPSTGAELPRKFREAHPLN
jgi:hypothetical protein